MRNGLLCICLGGVVACEGSSVPVGPGKASAVISGEFDVRFVGPASFTADDGRLSGQPASFNLSARTREGGVERELIFEIIGTSRPRRGRYSIRPAWLRNPSPPGFSAVYMETDSTFRGFASDSGEFEIVHSDPDRVDGIFRIIASRYCLRHADGILSGTCDPSDQRPGTPNITLKGSISAVRAGTVDSR